jgi:hypothetical protein
MNVKFCPAVDCKQLFRVNTFLVSTITNIAMCNNKFTLQLLTILICTQVLGHESAS